MEIGCLFYQSHFVYKFIVTSCERVEGSFGVDLFNKANSYSYIG